MLKMVDGTGIIGVDMICPLGVSTPQPPNYDRVEMEGTGMLVLPNSLYAPLERLELVGKTEQVTTIGAQLFDIDKFLELPSVEGGLGRRRELVIKLKPTTKYTMSSDIAGSTSGSGAVNRCLYFSQATDNGLLADTTCVFNNHSITQISDGEGHLKITLFDRSIAESIISRKNYVMLNEGSAAQPYEPYTGNKPSPSPEYPQEIKNSGKWNEETQKYEVDVKITNAEQNWSKEQTLTITSDRPITKWDRLVEQGGEIGWLYASKKYVITGNEFFEYRSGYDQDAYTNRFIVINDLFVNRLSDKQLAYCKILKRVQYIYAQNKLEEGIDTNVNQLHIKLSNDRIGVLSSDDTETRTAKIAEYIKNTYTDGIEILYATTDTVFLPLPQSEQNAIRALKTYYPTTVITADGGEVDPDIKVTYRKEI